MEISELLDLFVGKWAKNTFLILLAIYMYISLWSYSAVFSSSLLTLVPFPGISIDYVCDIYNENFPPACNHSYLLYMLLFFFTVMPLISMDLAEQVGIQIFLFFFRFTAILLMFITSMIVMYHTPFYRNEQGDPPFISFNKLFDFPNFGIIFPTAIFSQLLHHSIPGIIQPLKNKKWAKTMFSLALMTTFILYVALGIPSAMYFGKDVKPIISLNWKDYSGLGFEGPNNSPIWARIVSYIIVLFPVLDIISAFPLNGITLANTIFASIPARITQNGTNGWIRLLTRFMVAIPPIILGSFIKRLDLIIELAGTVGFFISFIVPGFLQIYSKKMTQQKFGYSSTPYSIPILSSSFLALIVIIFGLGSFIFQVINIGIRIHSGELKM